MDKIKHILLDLDGTLTDSKSGIGKSIQYALRQLKRPIPHIDGLSWAIGPPLKLVFKHLLDTEDQVLLNQAISHYRERYERYCAVESKPYDGIQNTLATLVERQYQLYLATSKPRVYAIKILTHLKLNHYFSSLHGSELNGRHDYKEDLIKYILETHQLQPEHTVMIGDRHYDIGGAQQNHIRSVAVSYGYGSRHELIAAGPDCICDDHKNWLLILRKAYL